MRLDGDHGRMLDDRGGRHSPDLVAMAVIPMDWFGLDSCDIRPNPRQNLCRYPDIRSGL